MPRTVRFDHTDRNWALGLIEPFVREFKGRVLPAFANMEAEANGVAEVYYRTYPGSEETDPADVAEAAWEAGFDLYEDLAQVQEQLTQLSIAGLYFLWERTVKSRMEFYFSHSRWRPLTTERLRRADFDEVRTACDDAGLVSSDFHWYDKLDELRLVTNTIKHAEGTSCSQLYERRKELFEKPGVLPSPLFGDDAPYAEDLYLEEKHFDEYAEAVKGYWIDVVESQQ